MHVYTGYIYSKSYLEYCNICAVIVPNLIIGPLNNII